MRLGYDPLKLLSLEGLELTVMKIVLERANELHAQEMTAQYQHTTNAVQIGVARAFGVK